jgi:hypothetical protein
VFRGGRWFLRIASVAALGATGLAVDACSAAPDPLATLTGDQVLAQALANFKTAQSMTVDGLIDQSGANLVLNVGIVNGQGCTGTVGNLAKGDIQFTKTGQIFYMKPDQTWWTNVAGSEGTGIGQLVNGRYLKAPISGSSAQDFACDIAQASASDAMTGTIGKGQITTLDGRRELALNDPNGDVMYVTDTSTPEIAQLSYPKPDRLGYSGQLSFNVGARVTLADPPSGQAVDAADFGITASSGGAVLPPADLGDTMITQAYTNLQAASSLTMDGSETDSGQDYSFNLAFKTGKGCTGTVGYGSKGSFKLVVIGSTVYFNPDNVYWETDPGTDASAVISTQNGRYIEGSAGSDSVMKNYAEICDITKNMAPSDPITGISTAAKIAPLDGITMGQITTINGIKALPLKDSTGGVVYVGDTGKLEIVKVSQDKAGGDGTYGALTFNVGAPVTLTAPPAADVMDGAQLGL